MDMNDPEWQAFSAKLMAGRHKKAQREFNTAKEKIGEMVGTQLAGAFMNEGVIQSLKKNFYQCKQEDKLLMYNMLAVTEKAMKEILPQALAEAAERILAETMTHEFSQELEQERGQWRQDNPDLAEKSIFDKDNEGAKFTLARR